MMDNADLDRIEALASAATPGEWIAEYSREQGTCVIPADAQSTREAVCVTRLYRRQADADFIAAARTAVPALVAEVRRLTAERDTLRARAERQGDLIVDYATRIQRVEALADTIDRDASEDEVRDRIASVRCARCDLRYEEREEYSCVIAGTAHDYLPGEIAEASEVAVVPTYWGERIRAALASPSDAPWEDDADAQRVIDQIMATGSDDEAVWVGIVADHDRLSDADRAEVTLTALAGQISDDRSQLRDLAVDAVRSGVLSEVRAAAAAGVSRPTIRSWLGK